jgi:hypothetical protein
MTEIEVFIFAGSSASNGEFIRPGGNPFTQDERVPDNEVYEELLEIKVHAYGDDTSGAYVQVAGYDKERVEAAYHRTWAQLDIGKWFGVNA